MAYKLINCGDYRQRRSFSRIKQTYELKDLLEIQKKSYQWFIDTGIKEVFEDLFPVENFSGTLSLEFGDYHFDEPRYSIKESRDRETTFAAPLKIEVRLFNHETGEVKEQEIFLGDMPVMTDSGTFIINGAERVIVSQLVRSPSVYFNREIDKNGRNVITSQIIPTRGTWLEFETDARDVIYVRIDRTRKVALTTVLRAFGLSSDEDIYKLDFYANILLDLDGFGFKSMKNLFDSISKSANTTLDRFIYALSIPLIGRSASKTIAKYFDGDIDRFYTECCFSEFDFTVLDDFGEAMNESINKYIKDNAAMICELSKHMNFEKPEIASCNANLSGLNFVITGSLNHFANRDEAKEKIEAAGGKVSGSVSAKTSYLVNNDITSTSGKNKKAKELNIPIIDEEELIRMLNS